MLHVANLLMVSIVGQQFGMMAQHRYLPVHSGVKPSHVRSSTTCPDEAGLDETGLDEAGLDEAVCSGY